MKEIEKLFNKENSNMFFDYSTDTEDSRSDESNEVLTKYEQLYSKQNLTFEINIDAESLARKKRKVKRQPTRKPDPNIYNRNALQARENRRKKKAHLETVERKLKECEQANSKLLKALKQQLKITQRLKQQKLYYKNILSNRTEISVLIAALNENLSGSSTKTKAVDANHVSSSKSFNSNVWKFDYKPIEEDTTENISLQQAWQELLSEDQDQVDVTVALSAKQFEESVCERQSKELKNENVSIQRFFDQINGICLHVASGKVSLEFCPTCHWKANEAVPNQILE